MPFFCFTIKRRIAAHCIGRDCFWNPKNQNQVHDSLGLESFLSGGLHHSLPEGPWDSPWSKGQVSIGPTGYEPITYHQGPAGEQSAVCPLRTTSHSGSLIWSAFPLHWFLGTFQPTLSPFLRVSLWGEARSCCSYKQPGNLNGLGHQGTYLTCTSCTPGPSRHCARYPPPQDLSWCVSTFWSFACMKRTPRGSCTSI